jgi:hypothetical protein
MAAASPLDQYRRLMFEHSHLFANPDIIESLPKGTLDRISIVGENQFAATKGRYLATYGVGPSLVLCSQGRTLDGVPVIGMAHFGEAWKIGEICHLVKKAMADLGCVYASIRSYVVGGELPTPDLSGSLASEIEVLQAAKNEGIVGVKFNYVADEDDATVVLSPESVMLSKNTQKLLYASPEIGVPLPTEDLELAKRELLNA